MIRHSVSFRCGGETRNTLTDWMLLQEQLPTFVPPKVRMNMIELPGASGAVDLSDTVTGYPLYQNREGSLKFLVSEPRRWRSTYNEIMEYLHGQAMEAVLEDEPDWCYTGRFWVDDMACEEHRGTIAISYSVDPYKWALQYTDEPWRWNPFSFIDGVIYNGTYVDTSVEPNVTYQGAGLMTGIEVGTTPIELAYTAQATGSAPQSVKFSAASAAVTITIMDGATTLKSFNIASGGNAVQPGLVLYRGKWLYLGKAATVYAQTASGTATLSLSFRPGRL